MNIGEAAAASGVSAKMIRHYETLGLIQPQRRKNNYRAYTEKNVAVLRFIRHARDLAFPLSEVKRLLGLWQDDTRQSADVRRIALGHVEALEEKARSLRAVADSLRHLARTCQGNERPECPILEHMEGTQNAHHPH
ncbi:MerR family transcriptional regulator [Roseococcus pinisoli]|uniref:MerR family transcriptional regulator n=1 Tax=Roseococcus pinisoli TaxID=2835040 RepID=A0ABS5QCM6_9PROT|nr:MerR family transcriptional regulator [Roseococcus pinisoli]MBS7811254.1 MerR family transcriptional regulator [Roseococcus pinisoli]